MFRICVLSFCAAYLLQAEAKFINCGSKAGHYSNVTVTECDEAEAECPLIREHDVTITIVFNVDTVAKRVRSEVHGVIAGVPIPFPISQPDACEKSGLACPLEKDKGPFTYANTLHVQRMYPTMALKVKWELKDEEGNDIVCVEIPSRIQ